MDVTSQGVGSTNILQLITDFYPVPFPAAIYPKEYRSGRHIHSLVTISHLNAPIFIIPLTSFLPPMPVIQCVPFDASSLWPQASSMQYPLLPTSSLQCLRVLRHCTTFSICSTHITHIHCTHLSPMLRYLMLITHYQVKYSKLANSHNSFATHSLTWPWRWLQLGSLVSWWDAVTTADKSCVKLGLRLSTSAVSCEVTLSNLHQDTASLHHQVTGDTVQSPGHNVTPSIIQWHISMWHCTVISHKACCHTCHIDIGLLSCYKFPGTSNNSQPNLSNTTPQL